MRCHAYHRQQIDFFYQENKRFTSDWETSCLEIAAVKLNAGKAKNTAATSLLHCSQHLEGWGARQARFLEEFTRLEVNFVVPETGARFSVMLSLLLWRGGEKESKPANILSAQAFLLQCWEHLGLLLVLLGNSARILPAAKCLWPAGCWQDSSLFK